MLSSTRLLNLLRFLDHLLQDTARFGVRDEFVLKLSENGFTAIFSTEKFIDLLKHQKRLSENFRPEIWGGRKLIRRERSRQHEPLTTVAMRKPVIISLNLIRIFVYFSLF